MTMYIPNFLCPTMYNTQEILYYIIHTQFLHTPIWIFIITSRVQITAYPSVIYLSYQVTVRGGLSSTIRSAFAGKGKGKGKGKDSVATTNDAEEGEPASSSVGTLVLRYKKYMYSSSKKLIQ